MQTVRNYGQAPFEIAVLHGGPGARGSAAPLAARLGTRFGVLEPLQTAFSINALVAELHAQLTAFAKPPVILIGHSWGAWLGILYAARFPAMVRKLILVSSGALQETYVQNLMPDRLQRLTPQERTEYEDLMKRFRDPEENKKDEIMTRFGQLMGKADAYDVQETDNPWLDVSYEAYQTIWPEAAALRRSGELLRLTAAVTCPLTAIHGDYDSTPPEGIEKPIKDARPDASFYLLENCGHEPWQERQARAAFFEIVYNEIEST